MNDAEDSARGTGLTRDCRHGEDWRSQCAEVDCGRKDGAQGAEGQARGRTSPRRDVCAGWDPVCSDDPQQDLGGSGAWAQQGKMGGGGDSGT